MGHLPRLARMGGKPEGAEDAERSRRDYAGDIDQLRCLVTLVIRQDRYCDGTLVAAFEDGIIRRVVTRAHDLLMHG